MHDMRITESEKKDMMENSIVSDKPKYPHGLKLHISPEIFEKLRLPKPEIGKRMKLDAIVEVVEVASQKMFGDDSNFSMELQITDMVLNAKEEEKSAEAVIYEG